MNIMPYSYGNIYSNFVAYIPIILVLLMMISCVVLFIKYRSKIEQMDPTKNKKLFISVFLIFSVVSSIILTIPYSVVSPLNENSTYELIKDYEVVSFNIDDQTVTYIKDNVEVTEPCLLTVSYGEDHLEVRRYRGLGMYRDYNVCCIKTGDVNIIGGAWEQ